MLDYAEATSMIDHHDLHIICIDTIHFHSSFRLRFTLEIVRLAIRTHISNQLFLLIDIIPFRTQRICSGLL